MKNLAILAAVAVLVSGLGRAQDAPKPPAPQKEHEWLKQLAGEWETDAEMVPGPGQPAVTCKGTESTRTLGGLWVVAESRCGFMGTAVTGQMTVGYDAGRKKYVGTWVCSMCDHLWQYEGTLDAAGKVLTLETEGPNPAAPGKTAKMRDVVEVKGPDHKVMTSFIQTDDGKWVPFMTMNARRKK